MTDPGDRAEDAGDENPRLACRAVSLGGQIWQVNEAAFKVQRVAEARGS